MMRAAGSHPTRQLNASAGPSMEWWSLWGDLWPAAMLLLLGAILVTLVCVVITVVAVIRTKPRRHTTIQILHAMLSLAQPILMFFLIGEHFPDA